MTAHDKALDSALVQALQGGLPRVARPYHAIAESIGVAPQRVMERLDAMLESGAIRRIGAVPNHYRLGWTANAMTVWDVDDRVVDALGECVGALDCVSHCYRRTRRLQPGRTTSTRWSTAGAATRPPPRSRKSRAYSARTSARATCCTAPAS
jgi:DNA-binding Lrp family transcriptional regulator